MKRLIQNLLVFFGLLVLGMFGMIVFKYFVIGSQYKYSYVASFYDKIERLESINEPKIILVGNSNLAFGMNSEKNGGTLLIKIQKNWKNQWACLWLISDYIIIWVVLFMNKWLNLI